MKNLIFKISLMAMVLHLVSSNCAASEPDRSYIELCIQTENYRRRRLTEQALKAANKAVKAAPSKATPYAVRALVRLRLNQNDRAIRDAEKATRLSPRDFTYWSLLGSAYLSKNNYEKSVLSLVKALSLDPFQNGPANTLRYLCAHGIRSRSWFGKVMKDQQSPDRNDFCRAFKLESSGKNKEALRNYSRFLQKYPDDIAALWYRGNLYKYLGQFDKAAKDYSAVISLSPTFALAYRSRSVCREKSNPEMAKQDGAIYERLRPANKAREQIFADDLKDFLKDYK